MKLRWKLIFGQDAKRVKKRAEKKRGRLRLSGSWGVLHGNIYCLYSLSFFCFVFLGMQKSVDAQLAVVSPSGSLGCLKALDLIASHTESQLHLLVVHPG